MTMITPEEKMQQHKIIMDAYSVALAFHLKRTGLAVGREVTTLDTPDFLAFGASMFCAGVCHGIAPDVDYTKGPEAYAGVAGYPVDNMTAQ